MTLSGATQDQRRHLNTELPIGRTGGFALIFFYAVHRLVAAYVKSGIDWRELMGDVLGIALFIVTLAVIMLWFAGRDDRPHLIKLGL